MTRNRSLAKKPQDMVGGQSLPKISKMLFKLFEQLYHDRINLEKESWPGFLSRIMRVTTLQYFCCNEICHILNTNNLGHIAQPINTLFYGFKTCLELMVTHFTRNINIQPAQKSAMESAQLDQQLTFEEYVKKRKMDKEIERLKANNAESQEIASMGNMSTETEFTLGNLEDHNANMKDQKKKHQEFEEKVEKILYNISVDPKSRVEMKKEDPEVLLEVALRLYSEIRKENEGMINDLNNYLRNSMRRNSVPYGTTVGLQLESCLQFFQNAYNAEEPPNEIQSEPALLEFYRNFNETERGIIHNQDIAQHKLVMKAVNVSRSMKPQSKDFAGMTQESCAGIDSSIQQAWEQGKQKGQEETEEEMKKRYESGNSLVDELNREIKNKKQEQGVLKSTMSDLQDEIMKLNHRIKELELNNKKNQELANDINELLSVQKGKTDSVNSELNFKTEKARSLTAQALATQTQASNIVKKIYDDKWFVDNQGTNQEKDPMTGVQSCLTAVERFVENSKAKSALPMFQGTVSKIILEKAEDNPSEDYTVETVQTHQSFVAYDNDDYSSKRSTNQRSKLTSAGMQSRLKEQNRSHIISHKEIEPKTNDKGQNIQPSRTQLEVKTQPSEVDSAVKVSPKAVTSKIDLTNKNDNTKSESKQVVNLDQSRRQSQAQETVKRPEAQNLEPKKSEIMQLSPSRKESNNVENSKNEVKISEPSKNETRNSQQNTSAEMKERRSKKSVEKDTKLKEKIQKNKEVKVQKDKTTRRESIMPSDKTEEFRKSSKEFKKSSQDFKTSSKKNIQIIEAKKSNNELPSDTGTSKNQSPKESRPGTRNELPKVKESSSSRQKRPKKNTVDVEYEHLETVLSHELKKSTFDFIKKEKNDKKQHILSKLVGKLLLLKRDQDIMALDDQMEGGKSSLNKSKSTFDGQKGSVDKLGSSTRITLKQERPSDGRNKDINEWSDINSFKQLGSDLHVLSEEKYEDEPVAPKRVHIDNSIKSQNIFKGRDTDKTTKPTNLIASMSERPKDAKFIIKTDISHREFNRNNFIKTTSTKDAKESGDQMSYTKREGSPQMSETLQENRDLFKKQLGFSTARTAAVNTNRFYQTTKEPFTKRAGQGDIDRVSTVENLDSEEYKSTSNKFGLTGQSFNKQQKPETKNWFTPHHLEKNRVFVSIQEFSNVGDGGLHELIHDRLNPFIAGRAKHMTFVKDLFEVLKPTLVLKLTKKGVVTRNIDKAAFDSFNSEFGDFMKIHMSCGPHCKHLMKFYQKIGFFKTLKMYNNKASLQLPILDFDKDYGNDVAQETMKLSDGFDTTREKPRSRQPAALKKNKNIDTPFPF